MESASPNFATFKEPKAFIKLLQILLTILAFALTTSFSSEGSFSYNCTGVIDTHKIVYSYPFNLNGSNPSVDICKTPNTDLAVFGNFSSQAQFFVFVGVVVMLYCFATIVLYVCFEYIYQNERVPKIDFIITLIIAVLWFIASVAWADGVSKLKQYSNINFIMSYVKFCNEHKGNCKLISEGSYGNLNASLIAGFANIALWAANLWFLFKETLWYERRHPDDQIIGNESVDGGNM